MDPSEDTENESSSSSSEDEPVPAAAPQLSQHTESESSESEGDDEPAPAAPAVVAVKRKAEDGPRPRKRTKVGAGPKGVTTAYIYFWQEAQAGLRSEFPTVPHKELARLCGQRWQGLSASEKQPFVERANADRARYLAEREAGGEVESKVSKVSSEPGKLSKKAPFVLFCKENRSLLKQGDPALSPAECRKLLGERWKALSPEARKAYAERSSTERPAVAGANVVTRMEELLDVLRKRVEGRMLRRDIGLHEMKGLLQIVCKSANFELLRQLDSYPSP